ncbi:hypothetical protein GOP47_0025336 [Adiantum capillus-veneris]|uniref:Uncharacterized protein n=1 Tax=Adiantum capillus-veneris TaxID=13818 RepID=A0A9D4Z3H9_ADICA|nr:hypothetical protein GOP47_0025336 [Adiantum capillus-veneris]
MAAVPPIPTTLCGITGSGPPIGITHFSSSSMFFTFISRYCNLWIILFLISSNGTPGLATKEVSSKKILFDEKGIA